MASMQVWSAHSSGGLSAKAVVLKWAGLAIEENAIVSRPAPRSILSDLLQVT